VANPDCPNNPTFIIDPPATVFLQYDFSAGAVLVDSSSNDDTLLQEVKTFTIVTVPVGQINNPLNTAAVIPSTSTFALIARSRLTFPTTLSVEFVFALPALTSSNQDLFAFSGSISSTVIGSIVSVNSGGALLLSVVTAKNTATYTFNSLTLAAGRLNHVVVTSSGTQVIFYLNGNAMTESPVATNLAGNNYFEIARKANMIADEVFVYSSTLSASVVEARYNSLGLFLSSMKSGLRDFFQLDLLFVFFFVF